MYNHPHTKEKNWYIKLFENADFIHLLQTSSRLVAFIVFIIAVLFGAKLIMALTFFAASMLSINVLFFFYFKSESAYKSKKFFKINKTTPHIMNKHHKIMLITKCVFFASLIPFGLVILYGAICIFISPIIAHIVRFKPLMMKSMHRVLNSSNHSFSPSNSSFPPHESNNLFVANHGLPGYDTAGNFTGSSTAIGGGSC